MPKIDLNKSQKYKNPYFNMNYTEIDWSKERKGKDKSMPILTKDQKIKNLSFECVEMGLTIRQSVDFVVTCMSS